MRGLPGFWVACRSPEALSDPLTVSVPGLGEALAVFCFLLGPWSRFDLITLDPMPGKGTGVMLRLASTHRDDFLGHLVHKYGLGAYDGDPPRTSRSGRHNLGHTRPDAGLVGGQPAQE